MFEDLKILYLEDEVLIALDTAEHLEALGFEEVKIAARLEQAEAIARETQIDMALLDINVDRGQTSLQLGEDLSKRGVKVIFASGNSSAGQTIKEDGICFLDKPFSMDQLSAVLKNAVSQPVSRDRTKTCPEIDQTAR